jgi:hypothetical protein
MSVRFECVINPELTAFADRRHTSESFTLIPVMLRQNKKSLGRKSGGFFVSAGDGRARTLYERDNLYKAVIKSAVCHLSL